MTTFIWKIKVEVPYYERVVLRESIERDIPITPKMHVDKIEYNPEGNYCILTVSTSVTACAEDTVNMQADLEDRIVKRIIMGGDLQLEEEHIEILSVDIQDHCPREPYPFIEEEET